jgi:hypothetical protein
MNQSESLGDFGALLAKVITTAGVAGKSAHSLRRS